MSTTNPDVRAMIRRRVRSTDPITLMAIGLAMLAATAAVVHSASPPTDTLGGDRTAADSTSLVVTDRIAGFGVVEPSGVVFDEQSGSLLVVGDEGSIAELGADHAALRSQPLPPGVEDVAIHRPSGLLVGVIEEQAELVVLDSETLSELRRFPLHRAAVLGTDPTGENNQGFEGLAFRADSSGTSGHPSGGVFYLTHQRHPAMVVAFSFDPTAAAHPIGAEAVSARWTVPGAEELNGVAHIPTLDHLLVVDDKRDALVVLDLDGRQIAELAVPGNQQEGVAIDRDGTLWIADDAGGALLGFGDAVAALEP